MPDRAIVPLSPAVAGGFIVGLIAAVLQLSRGPMLILLAVGAAATFAAGAVSVGGTRGGGGEKLVVGLLRAGLGAGVFALIYVAMIRFLRDGELLLALGLFAVAIVCAYPLTRMRVHPDTAPRQGDPELRRTRTTPG